jgi:hypothetical protein
VVDRETTAGAGEAGLNLVRDPENVVLGAEATDLSEVVDGR